MHQQVAKWWLASASTCYNWKTARCLTAYPDMHAVWPASDIQHFFQTIVCWSCSELWASITFCTGYIPGLAEQERSYRVVSWNWSVRRNEISPLRKGALIKSSIARRCNLQMHPKTRADETNRDVVHLRHPWNIFTSFLEMNFIIWSVSTLCATAGGCQTCPDDRFCSPIQRLVKDAASGSGVAFPCGKTSLLGHGQFTLWFWDIHTALNQSCHIEATMVSLRNWRSTQDRTAFLTGILH